MRTTAEPNVFSFADVIAAGEALYQSCLNADNREPVAIGNRRNAVKLWERIFPNESRPVMGREATNTHRLSSRAVGKASPSK